MMKYNSILIAVILLVTMQGFGQTSMSLEACVDYARRNHTEIRVAQLNVRDADWQIKENLSTALPQLSLGLGWQHYLLQPSLPAEAFGFGEPGTDLTFVLRNNISGNISLNQMLFNSSYLQSMKAARQYKEYVELQLDAAEDKVSNQVRDAYLPALLITESMEVLDNNIVIQEKLLNETREVFKAGFAEQLDVDRIDYTLSTLRTERDNLGRQQEILIDALKFAMGMPVSEPLSLSDDMDKLLAEYGDINPDAVLDYMNHPDYQVLLKARDLAEIQVNLYRKDWMPTVSLQAAYNPSFQGNEKLFWIPAAVVGVQVNMPIYDGGFSRAKQERATVQALQVDEQKTFLTRALDLELSTARKQFRSTKQKMEAQQQNLDLAQKIYDTTQTKYKAGVGSSFEVTQTQANLYMAQAEYINARFDYLSSIMMLREALGLD